MKKLISILLAVVLVISFTASSFAGFGDVPETASYAEALNRLARLGIMAGDENGMFHPESYLTREGFSKIIIAISGLESTAKAMTGATIYTDIPVNHWSTGYINAAVAKGFISGRPDGSFDPTGNVTFLEVCTGILKALGYTEKDLTGSWPLNYLSKMSELGITKDINLKTSDIVPRWVAAIMFDRLLTTPVKSLGGETQIFAIAAGLYSECIILADSTIISTLKSNQVVTNKGTFNLKDTDYPVAIGGQYAVLIEGNDIVKVFYELRTLDRIAVLKSSGREITYARLLQNGTMLLPDDINYYYNGAKINFESLDSILEVNSTMVFAWNKSRTGYEYAIIIDPVYSKPEVVKGFNPADGKIGSISIKNSQIIRNGEFISASGIQENDVAYVVSDILGTNRYILVVDKKVKGNMEGILPSSLAPKYIKINGQNYEFSSYMNFGKINTLSSEFRIGDNIVAILGYDNKVIDIYKVEDIGTEQELVVIGTAGTMSWLLDNQALTDKGLFYFPDGIAPELGMKYKTYVKGDKILAVIEKLSTLKDITVDSIVGNRITYRDAAVQIMTLPQNMEYYYNGSKLSGIDNVMNTLHVNTSIILADSSENPGYEYAIIIDPVYSKPRVVSDFNPTIKDIDGISLSTARIIKNGEIIDITDIKNDNVIYEVSDYKNRNRYVLVLDNVVYGTITGILPSKLSPNRIKIDSATYDLSPDMDYSKITDTTNALKINDKVKVLLGYDGKVVDILYTPEEDTSNYAYVVNFNQTISTNLKDYGEVVYYVKLLHTNGLLATYKTDVNPSQYKGTLVTFTKTDLDPDPAREDIMVSLKQVPLMSQLKAHNVNKNDRMIDNYFVTEKVTIINSINSTGYGDAEYDFMNWEELPHGLIEEGKVLVLNHVGEFDDINLILLNDLYDQKFKNGVIIDITQGYDYSILTMLIDGNIYTYQTPYKVSGEFGSVIKVKFINGEVTQIIDWQTPAKQTTKIQAVDSRRIKIDGVIYPFAENVNIYFRNNLGSFTLKGTDAIDVAKTYGKVSVYLTAPLEQRGKVNTIVILE